MSKDDGKFARLSEQQKWEWHADVYAFRYVVLGQALEEPSPCDEERRWYSEPLVRAAVERKQAKREMARRHRDIGRTAMLDGRARINVWARSKGQADIDAYAIASGMTIEDAYKQGVNEIMAAVVAEKDLGEPRHRRQNLDDVRRALGLAERKEFSPSPERMAADRAALGIATCERPAERGADDCGPMNHAYNRGSKRID